MKLFMNIYIYLRKKTNFRDTKTYRRGLEKIIKTRAVFLLYISVNDLTKLYTNIEKKRNKKKRGRSGSQHYLLIIELCQRINMHKKKRQNVFHINSPSCICNNLLNWRIRSVNSTLLQKTKFHIYVWRRAA